MSVHRRTRRPVDFDSETLDSVANPVQQAESGSHVHVVCSVWEVVPVTTSLERRFVTGVTLHCLRAT